MKIRLNTSFLRVLNIAGFLGTIAVNTLANTLPINGIRTGELSDLYPNLFVPAGLTFSIWGVIYLLLMIFTVYQSRSKRDSVVDRIGLLFFISSLANMAWIFTWHYKLIGISLIIMMVLLGSLLKIYLNLGAEKFTHLNKSFKWFISIPFSVYLGWITVATIANVTAFLVNRGWNGFGFSDQFWTVLVILTALGITLTILITRSDIAYSLVVVWALTGIVMKRIQADPVPVYSVIYAAAISGVVILLAIAVIMYLKRIK